MTEETSGRAPRSSGMATGRTPLLLTIGAVVLLVPALGLLGSSVFPQMLEAGKNSPVPVVSPSQTTKPTVTPEPTKTASPTPTPGPTPAPEPTQPPAPAPPVDYQLYTVVAGDTLTSIARAYGVTVNQIVDVNGITTPNLIHVGDVLRIMNH